MNLPKAISCKLNELDMDIKLDLAKAENRVERIKYLYRLGLEAEKKGLLNNEIEEKRVKCFNLATPRKPKLFV